MKGNRLLLYSCVLVVAGIFLAPAAHPAARARVIRSTDGGAPIQFTKRQIESAFRTEGLTVFDVNTTGAPNIVTRQYWYEWPPSVDTRHEISQPQTWNPLTEYSNSYADFPMDVGGDGWTDFIAVPRQNEDLFYFEQVASGPLPKTLASAVDPTGSRRCRTGGHSRDRVPADLWVVPFNANHASEMVLAQSLQGITGRHRPRLWLDRPNTMSAVLLGELEQEGVNIHRVGSVWELPDELWASASGFVLYEAGTPSLNAAISLGGLWDAVAADSSIADQVAAKGLQMIEDATGLDDQQVFEQYGDQFARGIAVDQALTKPAYLRDFAIQHRAFTFWANTDRAFRRSVVAALGPGTTVYGWGPSELQWISDFSSSGGGGGVAADWCVNLSAMSRLPVKIRRRSDRPPPDPVQEGERIVAFVLSDGDNIQWETGGMPLDPKWYASPVRGQVNMNWELSPLLARVAPRVLRYFYDNATGNDGFVAAGTPSYRYMHLEPDAPGVIDAQQVASYLRSGKLHIVSVINDNQGSLEETIPLLELPEVDGVIYKKYSPYDGLHGQMLWHGGKPAVSYKFVLWENHAGGSIEQVASAIAAMPASPGTDQGSYALVNVHAWSWAGIGGPIEAVKETIDRLPPNTRVVLIEDFFSLLRDNFGQPAPTRRTATLARTPAHTHAHAKEKVACSGQC